METQRLRGIVPAVPTPFRDDRLDAPALERLVAGLVPEGVDGFLILGSNGEAFSLTDAERREVLEAARRAIPRDRFFLAGCGAESTHLALQRVQEAAECGASAALVLSPHYLKGSFRHEGYRKHYELLADRASIPIYIYNIPQFTGVTLESPLLAELSRHPNIHGLKDSSGNLTALSQTLATCDPSFAVMSGSDKILAAALLTGAAGGVLALANVAPAACVKLFKLSQGQDWAAASKLQRELLPVGTAVTTRFGVPGLKAGLQLLGRDAGEPRLPLLPLGEDGRRELDTVFRSAGLL